ncbi:MAG: AAA family ATPase [Candidatus Thermoplasmatota archaeon]|nr:AAA family ATPase [Candidatus Thermoplasmatota archaeon]MBU1941652.1 AAA family ATPase [Candidatus Thermoplasmatota archaeon]
MNGQKQIIFKNKAALSPDYIPEQLPHRIEEIRKIHGLIVDSLRGNVTHLLVSGPPGTGKTAVLHHVFRSVDKDLNALLCYVNCFEKSTKMGVLYSLVLDFYRKQRPTRKMPSRRGIAYDELLDSFRSELGKSNIHVVVCLDEVDQSVETEVIHDLIRLRWGSGRVQVIGISNDPFVFEHLDPRTKSRLFPLKEIVFAPYTKEQMKEIVVARVEAAFRENSITGEAVDYLSEATVERKSDVRIVRETLLRAGELVCESGDVKLEVDHVRSEIGMAGHAKVISMVNALSQRERFILRLIPKGGTSYPDFYRLYRATDNHIGDRMLRNYMEKFRRLKLVSMETKGIGGSYFITPNLPKDVLFDN